MKPTFILSVTLCVIVFTSAAQKNNEVLDPANSPSSKLKKSELSLGRPKSRESVTLPISHVQIIDVRPDTSKFGVYTFLAGRYQYTFEKPIAAELNVFFNSYLENQFHPFGDTIIAYVKKMWIGEYDSINIERQLRKRMRQLFLKIEFYQKKERCFYPLYRYDTCLFIQHAPGKQTMEPLESVLTGSVRKLFLLKADSYTRLTCVTEEKVTALNEIPFMYPVIQDSLPAKGVFKSFEDFRNNQPRHRQFTIEFGKTSDQVFIPGEKIADSALIDYWGVCDGDHVFMKIGLNLFPLFRSGANYDLYAFDEMRISSPFSEPFVSQNTLANSGAVFNPNYSQSQTLVAVGIAELLSYIRIQSKKIRVFQLDLETGKLY